MTFETKRNLWTVTILWGGLWVGFKTEFLSSWVIQPIPLFGVCVSQQSVAGFEAWGAILGLPRELKEPVVEYQKRLLAAFREPAGAPPKPWNVLTTERPTDAEAPDNVR